VREGIRWRFLGLVLFIDAVVPFIFFATMLVHGQIKDWDIQNRRDRIPLYLFTLFCHMGGLWLAHELGKTELVYILLVFYVIAVVFFLITTRWKISLHAGVNTLLVVAINMFYDGRYALLFLLVPLVSWARVVEKHHSWRQVVVGASLAGGMTYLGLLIAGV